MESREQPALLAHPSRLAVGAPRHTNRQRTIRSLCAHRRRVRDNALPKTVDCHRHSRRVPARPTVKRFALRVLTRRSTIEQILEKSGTRATSASLAFYTVLPLFLSSLFFFFTRDPYYLIASRHRRLKKLRYLYITDYF